MLQSKSPTEECDFCGQKAVTFTAACGHHKVCVRCNATKKATSACSACLRPGRSDEDDENSDLDGNNEEWEALLQPTKIRKPSWLTAPTQPKISNRVSTNVQVRLPIFETMPIFLRPSQPSQLTPENNTTKSTEAGISDNISPFETETDKSSPTRVHRKPRRLQGQIASQMHLKPEKSLLQSTETHLGVIDELVVPVGLARDSESSPGDEGQGVASWGAKTPGAIMYSELRGLPSMYDRRRPRVPWEFQSFANLGERCTMMWREQTGQSPPRDLDENDQIVMGQGDVTQPDDSSDCGLGYIELEPSEDGTIDYEDSPLSSSISISSRENNTSPCKGQRITYDNSWVVPDGSSMKEQKIEDDDTYSDFDSEMEGPGFESDDEAEDWEGDDDFWVTSDRITRKGFVV
ncbi:uncharacterized protein LOC135484616 [Lineus longissimus]|uniref:uncharacterized protein LOC135484616 n=1 Tax=Lineus longissimus TaxID=88925 RepID=UPI00315CB8A1